MDRAQEELDVAQILLAHWDPLQMADLGGEPEQEYLFEAAQIVADLGAGTDRAGLLAYLEVTRRELSRFGDRHIDQKTAEVVLEWWSSVRDRPSAAADS